MTRVCLYMRISTDEDHQPTSLVTQRERLERYCQAMEDWRIVHAFEDQASGVTIDRPGLNQVLGLAREQRFDLLLVYRVDRLSRKVRQLAGLAEELDRLGIVLKSAAEPFDTGSPAGRMMLQMLGVFAEFEHATIVDRVTAGLERRVREGRWMSGRTPYGYTRANGLLVPDPVRAPIVRRIFELYAEGKLGTTAIARTLEAEETPAPRKHGWSPNALQLILANPAYRGLIPWNGSLFEGLHEPLVDQELFEKAQQILRRRGEDASLRRGNPSDFLLSGLVRCDHCGRAYVGTSAHGRSSRYTYYACSTRYKYGPSKCNGERLPKDRLEAAVLAQLAELYRDGHLIRHALAKAETLTAKERPRLEDQLASTRAEIAQVERKLERYFEAFETGELSAVLCQERVRGHRARLEALREHEADLAGRLAAQAHTPPDTATLAALADQLDEILTTESPEQAKDLLRLLIKEIRVHNRRRIVPTYRVPAAVRAIPSKVGGTGLEPVTPSLSILTRGRVGACLGFSSGSGQAGQAPTRQFSPVVGCDGCDAAPTFRSLGSTSER
jgi:site-specific DNA recombinase